MKVLLDTHVWHWASAGDPRLSSTATSTINNPAVELYLSSISVWEFLVHIRKRTILVNGPPTSWIQASLAGMNVAVLPITMDIAIQSENLPAFQYNDPADRFIAATALHYSLPLITADNKLQKWSHIQTIW